MRKLLMISSRGKNKNFSPEVGNCCIILKEKLVLCTPKYKRKIYLLIIDIIVVVVIV
jgi:hypothetical protein